MSEIEIPLLGGRTTPGIVRIGDTVRRPLTAGYELRHALLRHLEAVGFAHAPRLLGIDDRGREILTYVDGQVPDELGWFDTEQVARAASILRRYHDAAAPLAAPLGAETLCHGDASPCNFVFVESMPTALIDFDKVHPGPRARDIGYAAWLWLDIGEPALRVDGLRPRITSFARAYGAIGPAEVCAAMLQAQQWLMDGCDRARPSGPMSGATHAWAAACHEWLTVHADRLARA